MNRVLSLAAFATGTIALALSLVPRDPPPSPAAAAEPSSELSDELELLQRRVELLEDSNRELLNKVAQLQRGAVVGAGDAGVGAASPALALEVQQLRSEVKSLVTGEVLSQDGAKAYVKDTLREVMAEQQQERMQQFQARAEERAQEQREQWKKFIADAHLNYNQEQGLLKAVDAESSKRKQLMDEVRAGTRQMRDVQPELRQVRRETDKTAEGLLDQEQRKKYLDLRAEQTGTRARALLGDGEGRGGRGGRSGF